MKKLFSLSFIISVATFFHFHLPVQAQGSDIDVTRLLAWSVDGTFLIASSPGEIISRSQSRVQRLETLWRFPLDGSAPQNLGQGFNIELSSDGQSLFFTNLSASRAELNWQINLKTGQVETQSSPRFRESLPAPHPPGQIFPFPGTQTLAILNNGFYKAELWVIEEDRPPQLILDRQGEVFSELTWHPLGRALAFIRTPLGSETETNSELWRIDLENNSLTRLSLNQLSDRSPLWHPDGSRLALLRDGQLAIVPADRLEIDDQTIPTDLDPLPASLVRPPVGGIQLAPPAQIRVIHHASNTCRDVPVGQIDTIPFEEYVKRVVPHEVPTYWPKETLKAQAVAARTYGWFQYNRNPEADYHVTDWVNYQYMCDNTYESTNQATDDTQGEYLAHQDQVILAMFSAENSSPTKTNPYAPYLRAVDDPVSFGQMRFGHGYGMGQWGAQRWATWHDWSYQAILRHYYTDVTLEAGAVITDSSSPNVSLVIPWSNHYLTSNKLWLLPNITDDSSAITQTNIYLSTPLTTTVLISQSGSPPAQGYVLDVSHWPDQNLISNSLIFTAEAYDATGKRSVSPPVTIGLDRIKPSGHLTLTVPLTGSQVLTGSLGSSLIVNGTDSTAGLSKMALGSLDNKWEGEDFSGNHSGSGTLPHVIYDPDALNLSALQLNVSDIPPGVWSITTTNLSANTPYRAYFRIRTDDNTLSDEIATLEVVGDKGVSLIGIHRLRGIDFRAPAEYQEFHVDFVYSTLGTATSPISLTFRLDFLSKANIILDRLIVLDYPIPFQNNLTGLFNLDKLRLKLLDGAANISEDIEISRIVQRIYRLYLPILLK